MNEVVLKFFGVNYKLTEPKTRDDYGSGECTGCAFYGVPEGASSKDAWDFCLDVAARYCTTGGGGIFVKKESE